ncbi:MAG: ABC transporter permease [Candidatus Melainabacteria bacterium]|nr:ABC transporter permease [Candidatus Melainabacteria bacterium]
MDLWELVKLAWQGIVNNRLRSGLTVLGIIIGIAAVIALLAIGQGAKLESERQIQALGSNLVFVMAGAALSGHVSLGLGSASTLTWEDAQAIRDVCPAVENVAPGLDSLQQAQWAGQNTNTNIAGTVPEYPIIRNFYPARGRFFNQSEVDHNARVCVLGETVANNLFGTVSPIGKQILIRGEFFDVIGVMEHKGATQFRDMDDQIFVPLSTAYNRIFGLNAATGHRIQFLLVQAKSQDDILQAQFQITNLLRLRHKIRPPMVDDFRIRTQMDLLQTAESITSVFTVLLGSTAGISLIVGGIGIMNIMLVSVTERTREIGIRKAVGARFADIMWQFIIEASVLSMSGGMVGIVLGLVSSHTISHFLQWTTVVTPWSVVLAFAVSVAVGLFFGIYPARQAARLDPIVALRAE